MFGEEGLSPFGSTISQLARTWATSGLTFKEAAEYKRDLDRYQRNLRKQSWQKAWDKQAYWEWLELQHQSEFGVMRKNQDALNKKQALASIKLDTSIRDQIKAVGTVRTGPNIGKSAKRREALAKGKELEKRALIIQEMLSNQQDYKDVVKTINEQATKIRRNKAKSMGLTTPIYVGPLPAEPLVNQWGGFLTTAAQGLILKNLDPNKYLESLITNTRPEDTVGGT